MDSAMTGHCATEKEALIQFRRMLSDILTPDTTDVTLLKWLRAKNFDLKKCEDIYRVSARTKAALRIDELKFFWKIPEVIKKYEFANYMGIAKDGTPIRYIAFGRGDLKGFYMSLDYHNIGKYSILTIEKDLDICKEQSSKLGKEISEVTYIVDMECFNLRRGFFFGIVEMGIDLLHNLQDHFPEIWKNILVVNVPYYFSYVLNFFKPIMRLAFLEKLKIASKGQSADLLLQHIDADVLPMFLGGKRVDSKGDPMCSEFMKFGGTVSENYYLCNRYLLQPTDPDVEDVWIPPKSVHNIVTVVQEARSIIHMEMRSEGGSLLCTTLYRKLDSNSEKTNLPDKDDYLDTSKSNFNVVTIVAPFHLHTHISPIDNCLYAQWPGIYIFRVDNTYSFLSGRRCIYRIRVEPPSEDKSDQN